MVMTELEQAKYLALSQIKDRWADPLKFEERQELYKYLVKELQGLIWDGEEADDQAD